VSKIAYIPLLRQMTLVNIQLMSYFSFSGSTKWPKGGRGSHGGRIAGPQGGRGYPGGGRGRGHGGYVEVNGGGYGGEEYGAYGEEYGGYNGEEYGGYGEEYGGYGEEYGGMRRLGAPNNHSFPKTDTVYPIAGAALVAGAALYAYKKAAKRNNPAMESTCLENLTEDIK